MVWFDKPFWSAFAASFANMVFAGDRRRPRTRMANGAGHVS
jgi:hypothetical protein